MAETTEIAEILSLGRVVPVLTIERVEDAVPLAEALVAGGLPALEITFRTDAALDAVKAVAQVPGAMPGVGTLTRADEFAAAADAGARFAVSPGFLPELAAVAGDMPYLPAVATASECMAARAAGFSYLKFFPAGPAGGVAALKALGGPFADLRFCPTGGVNADNAADYLALANVVCVGGSWVAPRYAVAAGDWAHIEQLARAASGL